LKLRHRPAHLDRQAHVVDQGALGTRDGHGERLPDMPACFLEGTSLRPAPGIGLPSDCMVGLKPW
jgi:hypothetical protein